MIQKKKKKEKEKKKKEKRERKKDAQCSTRRNEMQQRIHRHAR